MVSKIEYLKSISFFKDLSQSDLEKIESYSILRKYPKGSIMMYEGE
ncbi:MAG: Crp/Fnr family transcriptional regulator, partial [Campylobacterales bacterium]|nr:Crp/Fnr family transcriptional regulator [Campylobacterales bacterium]